MILVIKVCVCLPVCLRMHETNSGSVKYLKYSYLWRGLEEHTIESVG